MINSKTINDVAIKLFTRYWLKVAVFNTYALIEKYDKTITYIDEDMIVDNYQVDISTIYLCPDFQFFQWFSPSSPLKDYAVSPTKRWILEHRIAEIIRYHGTYRYMAITDDYIIVDMGYVRYWISDHDIFIGDV